MRNKSQEFCCYKQQIEEFARQTQGTVNPSRVNDRIMVSLLISSLQAGAPNTAVVLCTAKPPPNSPHFNQA